MYKIHRRYSLNEVFDFRASELDSMRIYKPWLHPDVIFSIYGKLTGLNKVYKTLHKLPNQVIEFR